MELGAIIFDVDGTLAETEEHHRLAFNRAFAEAGLGWSWDRPLYAKLLQVTGGKERIRHFLESRDDADRAEIIRHIGRLHARKTHFYTQAVLTGEIALKPGVEALMAEAQRRRVRLAIATTTSRSNVQTLVDVTLGPDAMGRFDAIVCGEDTLNKKPAPDVYLEALRRLNISNSDAIAVEDSRNGLLSALAAGLQAIVTPSLYFAQDDFSGAAAIVQAPQILSWLGWEGEARSLKAQAQSAEPEQRSPSP